jgi:hypothetical protein
VGWRQLSWLSGVLFSDGAAPIVGQHSAVVPRGPLNAAVERSASSAASRRSPTSSSTESHGRAARPDRLARAPHLELSIRRLRVHESETKVSAQPWCYGIHSSRLLSYAHALRDFRTRSPSWIPGLFAARPESGSSRPLDLRCRSERNDNPGSRPVLPTGAPRLAPRDARMPDAVASGVRHSVMGTNGPGWIRGDRADPRDGWPTPIIPFLLEQLARMGSSKSRPPWQLGLIR